MVVVSIIALLVSILLPSLKGAREQAKSVVCGSHQGALGRGLGSYAAENHDWIPGINTSGVELSALRMCDCELLMVPDLPVQTYDWITPILRLDTKLPYRRAERFKLILEGHDCPSLPGIKATLYGQACDKPEFEALHPWTPPSYLMPEYFQLWGSAHRWERLSDYYCARQIGRASCRERV